MTIRTYKVTLDSKNSIAPEPVFLRQGDKTGAVVINATLMDNGSPVSLDGLTPMFKANTADGQAVIADSTGFTVTDSANGNFTYQVPNALSSVPGKITTAYFSFSDSSGSESTFDVAFVIKKAVDITKPQAEDYITIIDGTIQSLQQKIDAMNTDIQTILNAFNQGDFYNKTQTDDKDATTLASANSYSNGLVDLKLGEGKESKLVDLEIANSEFFPGDETLRIYRVGKIVFLLGCVSTRGKTGNVCEIPVGFRPAHNVRVDCPQQSSSMDHRSRVYVLDYTLKVFAVNGGQPTWLDHVCWTTNDDFPEGD